MDSLTLKLPSFAENQKKFINSKLNSNKITKKLPKIERQIFIDNVKNKLQKLIYSYQEYMDEIVFLDYLLNIYPLNHGVQIFDKIKKIEEDFKNKKLMNQEIFYNVLEFLYNECKFKIMNIKIKKDLEVFLNFDYDTSLINKNNDIEINNYNSERSNLNSNSKFTKTNMNEKLEKINSLIDFNILGLSHRNKNKKTSNKYKFEVSINHDIDYEEICENEDNDDSNLVDDNEQIKLNDELGENES